ncbi:MAG: hypothetical protein JRD89_14240, partial [Deltaproteobacteria bacterium]|nr:hypothetical protein [Deltaproteobacteria bacterium]
ALGRFDHRPELQAEEEEEPAPRRGRKKKKLTKTAQRQRTAREMLYDEWCDSIEEKCGWEAPGVRVRLERIEPEWYKIDPQGGPVKVGGLLDHRESGRFSESEIRERFGGGTFQIIASIPNINKPGYPPVTYKKRFSVAGVPKLPRDMAPGDTGAVLPQHKPQTSEA